MTDNDQSPPSYFTHHNPDIKPSRNVPPSKKEPPPSPLDDELNNNFYIVDQTLSNCRNPIYNRDLCVCACILPTAPRTPTHKYKRPTQNERGNNAGRGALYSVLQLRIGETDIF
ncbi:hypothetical protein Trydic_g8140 [Trypoxylus dichotomus]